MSKKIVYFVSRYPSLSHTFILREIQGLRTHGLNIHTASINHIDRMDQQLTEEERLERDHTFYIKKEGVKGAVKAALQAILGSPLSFFYGFFYSLWLGRHSLRGLVFSIFYFVEALILGRWMKKIGADHLHVHFGNAAATVGLIASKIFSIPFSLSVHGPDLFFHPEEWLLPEKIKGAQFVRCIGSYAQSQLKMWSEPDQWDKIKIVPLGVNPNIFSPQQKKERGGPFEILCVGRLVAAKGQHVLIEAIHRLVKDGKNVHLTFVGDGPDRESLIRKVREDNLDPNITFAGAINQKDIREYYHRSNLFVLPSFAEGIPVVLMEAMAMEIPSISTYVNGIPELIRDQVDGLLVSPGDYEGLASAILDCMDNPDLLQKLGKNGRRRVLENYHLEKNIGCLVPLFIEE